MIADSVMDITTARLKFARSLHLQLQQGVDIKGFKQQVTPYLNRQSQGLMLTADVISNGSVCQIQFPDHWKIYPDDANIRAVNVALNAAGAQGGVEIKYT